MKKKDQILDAKVAVILEEMGNIMENWQPYQEAREKLVKMMEDQQEPLAQKDEKETLLTDYEITITIAAYFLGMQAGYREAKKLQDDDFVKQILEKVSPLSKENKM